MILYTTTFASPAGPFSLAVDEAGALVATAFGNLAALRGRLARQVAVDRLLRDEARTASAREQVRDYFRGTRRTFALELAPVGSAFQKRVWAALQRIPFGETRTYGQLAARLRSSPRAVGRANATNPLALVVPCHRVIGANGALTGFAFGEHVKDRLLRHERHGASSPA